MIYWVAFAGLIFLVGKLIGWKYVWIVGLAAGALSYPISNSFGKLRYKALVKKSGHAKTDNRL